MAAAWARPPTSLRTPVAAAVVHRTSGWPPMAWRTAWQSLRVEAEWAGATQMPSEERGGAPLERRERVPSGWVAGPPPSSVGGPVAPPGMGVDKQAGWELPGWAEQEEPTFVSTKVQVVAVAVGTGEVEVGEVTASEAVRWGVAVAVAVRV